MNEVEHLLVILSEEADEVGHRTAKALRFGLHEVQDGQEIANVVRIAEEISDLLGVVQMLFEKYGVDVRPIPSRIHAKRARVEGYMKYAEKIGTLYGSGE